jgi:hypothetical protein
LLLQCTQADSENLKMLRAFNKVLSLSAQAPRSDVPHPLLNLSLRPLPVPLLFQHNQVIRSVTPVSLLQRSDMKRSLLLNDLDPWFVG